MFDFKSAFILSKKEFNSIFGSPTAYVVMVIFLLLSAWVFWLGGVFSLPFFVRGQAEMRSFFTWLPLLFSFIIPALTMRLFSEEINTGSYELIATLPLSNLDIVIAKFLSALYFLAILLAPTLVYPISIAFIGDLDWGAVVGGYIGTFFLGAAYISIGLFTSSLSRNQIVAYIVAVAICFLFWGIDNTKYFMPSFLADILQALGTNYHFQNIAKGVVDIRDLIFFISFPTVFLYSTSLSMKEKSL